MYLHFENHCLFVFLFVTFLLIINNALLFLMSYRFRQWQWIRYSNCYCLSAYYRVKKPYTTIPFLSFVFLCVLAQFIFDVVIPVHYYFCFYVLQDLVVAVVQVSLWGFFNLNKIHDLCWPGLAVCSLHCCFLATWLFH